MNPRPLEELTPEIEKLSKQISDLTDQVQSLSPPLKSETDLMDIGLEEGQDAEDQARKENKAAEEKIKNDPEIRALNEKISALLPELRKLVFEAQNSIQFKEAEQQKVRFPKSAELANYKFVRVFKLATQTSVDGARKTNYGVAVPKKENPRDGYYDGYFRSQLWPVDKLKELTQLQSEKEYSAITDNASIKLDLSYIKAEYEGAFDSNPYKQQNSLRIVDMNNYSGVKNVGKAWHELAFRLSISLGAQGRVNADASWGSDTFHYLQGFRGVNEYYNKKIQDLVNSGKSRKEILKIYKDNPWPSTNVYLLPTAIHEKLNRLGLAQPSPQPAALNYVYIPDENVKEFNNPANEKIYRLAFSTLSEANEFLADVKVGKIIKMSDLPHLKALRDQPPETISTIQKMLDAYCDKVNHFLVTETDETKMKPVRNLLQNLLGVQDLLQDKTLHPKAKLDALSVIPQHFESARLEFSAAGFNHRDRKPLIKRSLAPKENSGDFFQHWEKEKPVFLKLVSTLQKESKQEAKASHRP